MKPNVFKSILLSVVAFIVFFLCYILSSFVILFAFGILSKIPIVNTLLGWLFHSRGDSPGELTVILSAVISYVATTSLVEKISKETATGGLSVVLSGSYILIIQSISLIINIVSGGPFIINIVLIVSSISMIVRGKNNFG